MPFLRKRQQRFGQQLKRAHFQCRFAAFGDEARSFYADEIAKIEQPKKIDQLRPDLFRVNVDLNAPRRVAQIEEMTFSHVAMRGDAAGCAKSLAFLKLFAHLRDRSGYLKAAAERLDAFRTKRVQFLAPERGSLIFFIHPKRIQTV